MNQQELKRFVKTARKEEIIKYWQQVLAPKYGYTKLVDPVTGKIVAIA